MNGILILLLIIAASALAHWLARRVVRIKRRQQLGKVKLVSRPGYYGTYAILWSVIPPIVLAIILAWQNDVAAALQWAAPIGLYAVALGVVLWRIVPQFNARHAVEGWGNAWLLLSALIAISITVLIALSLFAESARFFRHIPLHEFLFGTQWSPQMALRADQAGSSGAFGAVPVFVGTFLITLVALLVAAPMGLLAAVYLSEYASASLRNRIKPVLEVLAGVPTVVYGYFAAVTLAPFLRDMGVQLGITIDSESALAAGMVMGVMIMPFVMSLSDDVMKAVPYSLREASLGLGATQSETICKVVFPAALPGIIGALLLAISRAIGETMIVVMAAGLAANLTLNPMESVTTVTVQIVKLLVGDQEFDSPKTLAAFALSLTLFVLTFILNIAAMLIVKKYRERYE